MIYLAICALSAFLGLGSGLGATTLLRPMLDAVSPLPLPTLGVLCTMAALCAALVSAFFALREPIALDQDSLLLLSVGAALGGVLGDLLASRFLSVLPAPPAVLLQNALLFTLSALPLIYFQTLSRTLRPLQLTQIALFPAALALGLFASFLAFGAEPLSLMVFFLLFDMENDEGFTAVLTVTLFSMAAKLVTMLIRYRLNLPDAEMLLLVIPGAIGGALLAMVPALQPRAGGGNGVLLRLSLFTSLINMAAALA